MQKRSRAPRAARSQAQLKDASRRARPAVERTLLLLESLARSGKPSALKELSLMRDIPQTTAFRLCQRLEEQGFLAREHTSRRYTIGVRLMRLGLDIVRASGPSLLRNKILSEVVAAIGETCNLTVPFGHEVLYLDRVETAWPLRLVLEPGSRVPLHCTASGKLFLASMSDEMRETMLASLTLTESTPRTIVAVPALRRELARIRKRGYAIDNEEFLAGLVAIAVPVKDAQERTFAAVACHAPLARIDLDGLVRAMPRLQQAARKIARTFDATAEDRAEA
ncbi:MAG: IclR family transcriptional regulator [Hyphomicrobiaceae bacterium]|nr:IclR family transcriptional regulator [Hyphomicrobiaceae bacterium]